MVFLLELFIPFNLGLLVEKWISMGVISGKLKQKKQQERNKNMEQNTQEEERLKMVQETD